MYPAIQPKENTMISRIHLRTARVLVVAGLALGAALTQAAFGVLVTRTQEAAVKIGMSAAEVQQILGRPARDVTYNNASGPSWNYYVAGTVYGTTEFGVDFGRDGKVASAREYWRPTIGG